ncbi:MAG: alpha/beta fold hydrolase [Lautropia sp.]
MPHRIPLVFAHGNGIPRPVYQKLLIGLSHRFIPTGIDRFGHDPAYPVTDAWPRLLDQLRNHVAALGQPVVLLGHGCGGWLSLLTAYRAPERVRAVILLDAALPTVAQARTFELLKRVGLGRLPATFGAGADQSGDDIDPECRALFRRFGSTTETARAETRRFDAAVARRIHETCPTALAGLVAGGPPVDGSGRVVPCGAMIGERSRLSRLIGLAATRRLVGEHLARIEGSHQFPLERPLVAAKEIVHLHDRMVGAGTAPAEFGLQPLQRVRSRAFWQPVGQ